MTGITSRRTESFGWLRIGDFMPNFAGSEGAGLRDSFKILTSADNSPLGLVLSYTLFGFCTLNIIDRNSREKFTTNGTRKILNS